MDDEETTTAYIFFVDSKANELIVDVLESNRPYAGREQHAFTIPIGRILTVHSAPMGLHPHIHSLPLDPCRTGSSLSASRFFLFAGLLFICIPGSIILFISWAGRPYGIQGASLIVYSAAVALYTFGTPSYFRNRYLFHCPRVQIQLPRLISRHVAFLVALFVFQTAALKVKPSLPEGWVTANGRNMSPFFFLLSAIFIGLGITQIMTNRALLERAHLEYTPVAVTRSEISS